MTFFASAKGWLDEDGAMAISQIVEDGVDVNGEEVFTSPQSG